MNSATIKINLSSGILQNAQAEAERIGITVQDFIRMLMGTYFSNANSIQAISRDQYLLKRAQSELMGGAYTEINNAKELQKHLDDLLN
jgi:antitoxin component of RelBE/YafQ-DinJ toxin-antitoxin module